MMWSAQTLTQVNTGSPTLWDHSHTALSKCESIRNNSIRRWHSWWRCKPKSAANFNFERKKIVRVALWTSLDEHSWTRLVIVRWNKAFSRPFLWIVFRYFIGSPKRSSKNRQIHLYLVKKVSFAMQNVSLC